MGVSFRLSVWSILLFSMAGHAVGQDIGIPVRIFAQEIGLRYESKKLLQDQTDFLWIMYGDRLQRFDGRRMETYLSGSGIYSLLCDTAGRIWATQQGKVLRFSPGVNRFLEVQIDDTIGNKVVYQTDGGQLMCLSTSGMYAYNPGADRFLAVPWIPGEAPLRPRLSFERFSQSGSSVFFTVDDTLYRYQSASGALQRRVFGEFRKVTALTAEWVVVSDWQNKSWLCAFDRDELHPLALSATDPFLIVYDALQQTTNCFYLATSKGLLVLDIHRIALSQLALQWENRMLPTQRFNALFRTPAGAVWTATNAHLIRFNERGDAIHFNGTLTDVRNFAADGRGNLWLATVNGLACWELASNRMRTIRADDRATDRLNHPSIRGIVYDGTYLIVGQTNKGIWLFHPMTGQFRRPTFERTAVGEAVRQRLERDFINQIYTLHDGKHVIAARDGAYLMDGSTYCVTALEFPGDSTNVKFSYESRQKCLYIGTAKGLYALDSAYQLRYVLDEGEEMPRVFTMLEYGRNFYLGTERGLYLLTEDRDRAHVEEVFPALRDKWVTNVFTDSLGIIWGTTENRIFRIDPIDGTLTYYGHSENVRAKFFYPDGYSWGPDGYIYLGGLQGVNFFRPDAMGKSMSPLKPRILSLSVIAADTVYYDFRQAISLKNRYHDLEIGFTVPYYGSQSDLHFRYRLHPSDSWHEIGNQTNVVLWDLPPGTYDFQVEASTNGVVWDMSANSLQIVIVPPFWKTNWFVGLIGLGVVVLGYQLYRSFARKLMDEKVINAFATSLYGQSTVADMLWDLARNCVQRLGFVDCVVYLRDPDRDVMVQTAACGYKNPYGREISNPLEIPVGQGIVGYVAKTGIAECIADTHQDERYIIDMEKFRSEIAVPIWVDGALYAIIDSEHPKRSFYKRHHLKVLTKIAAICAERISKFLSEENLRAKIARDLHDEMGSTLTSINITSKIAEQDLPPSHPVRDQLIRIHHHTRSIMEKMGDMVWVVNPANDNFKKVIYRIKEYAVEILDSVNIKLSFRDMKDAELIRLNPEQRKNLYLIAKESLNNAVKYSGASHIDLVFKEENKQLMMQISDDGRGYDPNYLSEGNGIPNMGFRAEEINAKLHIYAALGKGVRIELFMDIGAEQHYIKKKYSHAND